MNRHIGIGTFGQGWVLMLALATLAALFTSHAGHALAADNPNPPASRVKLVFIHHSTGGNWLADQNMDGPSGGLGRALMQNNYFVSATNYGWGPGGIGDRTDIVNWPEWFIGPERDAITAALYAETGQNVQDYGAWPRLSDPGGANEIILFKSCFPNSNLYGNPWDEAHGEPNDWEYSVGNAKAVYNALLSYFASRPDKLFVVITAPPLAQEDYAYDPDMSPADRAANARALNNWLVNDWLRGYGQANVAVFDYYTVLTSNGGSTAVNDAGGDTGNHHRWRNGAVEHAQGLGNNFAAYSSGDSHPTTAGHQKATAEFAALLNVFTNRWKGGATPPLPETFSDEQWITSFYVAYWDRAPDADGHAYWMDTVNRGELTIPKVAENFALSDEAKAMYPYFNSPETATDAERSAFVRAVYRNLLDREVSADDEGVLYWVGVLRSGASTPGLVIGNIIYAAMQGGGTDWETIRSKVIQAEQDMR